MTAGPVLVTGGAGFIGCRLVQRLTDFGVPVVVLDVLHPHVHATRARPPHLPAAAELVIGDVTDPETVGDVVRRVRPRTVVHLAAETGTGQSQHAASRHGLVNVVGTTRLLDAISASAAPVEHIVLASSRAVYGEGQWMDERGRVFAPGPRRPRDLAAGRWDPVCPSERPVPVPHCAGSTPAEPCSVYGATKLAQELVLMAWCSAADVGLSILRLQNVYGPGQSLSNRYAGVLSLFARVAVAGGVIDVFEDGAVRRDFVFVDDACRALSDAVRLPPPRRRVVDIGSGSSARLVDVARAIAASVEAPEPAVSGRFRVGDVRAAGCDIELAALELGYRPQWSLERGLEALVASVRQRVPAPAVTW